MEGESEGGRDHKHLVVTSDDVLQFLEGEEHRWQLLKSVEGDDYVSQFCTLSQ